MPKEYRTIQEVEGPLMLVRGVEGVTYNELGEIELFSGEKRRCKVLEIDGGNGANDGQRTLASLAADGHHTARALIKLRQAAAQIGRVTLFTGHLLEAAGHLTQCLRPT